MVSTLVEHEYIATEDDELTINPGDIITEVVKQEGGWWEGVLNGKKGVFPENFVKEIKVDKPPVVKKQTSVGGHVAELASKLGKAGGIKMDAPVKKRETSMKKLGRAKVVFSYTPQNEDELGLEVDTIVDVTTQVEEGWWEGVANGKTGLFPSNFVELLDEEPETEKIVQAKKVVGVGLGNIFGNSPITLRSQGVQPVRRQDIASSEKQDGPELKNKKGSPRDVPASPRDVPTEAPVVANKEPKETKRARSWPIFRHADMHACSGSSVARSRSFCAHVDWHNATALKYNTRSIGCHKKRKVYSLTSDGGSTYTSGTCKRKRIERLHQWSPEASPGVCDSSTCFVVQNTDSPGETSAFVSILERESGLIGEKYRSVNGLGEMVDKPSVLGREVGDSACGEGVAAAAATVAAEAAAEAVAEVGPCNSGQTHRYLTYNMSGSCMMVHSMEPTFTDTTYTIETVQDICHSPMSLHSSHDSGSAIASVSPEQQTAPWQESELRKYVCYNMDGACMMVHSMKPTSPLSDGTPNPSSNTNVNPELDVVTNEGWSNLTWQCHQNGDTPCDFVSESEIDVDLCFANAEAAPPYIQGMDWEDVEAQLNRVAINDTYLIANSASEYSDGDIKCVDISDYIRITQGSTENPCCTHELDLPVDSVLMAWDTGELIAHPQDSDLRSVVEDSVQLSHDTCDKGQMHGAVDKPMVEGKMCNPESFATGSKDNSVGVSSGSGEDLFSDVCVDSLPEVYNDDSRSELATDRVVPLSHNSGGDASVHQEDNQEMSSVSMKDWDFTPLKDRKLMFDSALDDSWMHGLVTQSVGSVEMLVGDSLAVSNISQFAEDKHPVADNEEKLADDVCPAAGDACDSPRQRQSALWGVLQVGLSSVHDAFSKVAGDQQSSVVGQFLSGQNDIKAALTPPKVKIFRKGRSRVAPMTSSQVYNPLFRSTPIGDEGQGLGVAGGRYLLDVNDTARSGSASPFSDHGPFWSSPDINPPSPHPNLLTGASLVGVDTTEPTTGGKAALSGPVPLGDGVLLRVPVSSELDKGEACDNAMTLDESQNYSKQPRIAKTESYQESNSSVTNNNNMDVIAGTDPCLVPGELVGDIREKTSLPNSAAVSVEEMGSGVLYGSGLQSRVSLSSAGRSAFHKVPMATGNSRNDKSSGVLQLSVPLNELVVTEPRRGSSRRLSFGVEGVAVPRGTSGQSVGAAEPQGQATSLLQPNNRENVQNQSLSSAEHNRNENNISNLQEDIDICEESNAVSKTTPHGRTGRGKVVLDQGLTPLGTKGLTGRKDNSGKRRSSLSNFACRIIRRLSNRSKRSPVTRASAEGASNSTYRATESGYECPQIDIECKQTEESFHSPTLGFTSPTSQGSEEYSGVNMDVSKASDGENPCELLQQVSGSPVCLQDEEITVEPAPTEPATAKVPQAEAKPMSPIVTYIQHLKKRGRIPPSIRNMMRKYSIFGESRSSRKGKGPSDQRKQWEKNPGSIHLASQLSSNDVTECSAESMSSPGEHHGAARKLSAQHVPDAEPSTSKEKYLAQHVSIKDVFRKKFHRQASSPNTSKDTLPADVSIAGVGPGVDLNRSLRNRRKSSVWRRLSSVLMKRSATQRQHMKTAKSDSALENRGFVDDNGSGEVKEHENGNSEDPLFRNIAVTVQTEVTFDDFWKMGKDRLSTERTVMVERNLEADHSRLHTKSTCCNDLVTLYSPDHANKWHWMHSDVRHRDLVVYPLRSISPSQLYFRETRHNAAGESIHTEAVGGLQMGDRVVEREEEAGSSSVATETKEKQLPEIFIQDNHLDIPQPGPAIVIRDTYSPVHLSNASSMHMFTPTRIPSLLRVASGVGRRTPMLQDWESAKESSSNMTLFSTQSFSSTGLDYDTGHNTDIYYTPVSFLEDPVRFSDSRSSVSENYYSPQQFFLSDIGHMSSSFAETRTIVTDVSSSDDEKSCTSQFISCSVSRRSGESPSGSQRTLEAETMTLEEKPIEQVNGVASDAGYFRPILAGVSGILSSGYEYLMSEGSVGLSAYSDRFAALFGPSTNDGDNLGLCEEHNASSDAGGIQRSNDGDNLMANARDILRSDGGDSPKSNIEDSRRLNESDMSSDWEVAEKPNSGSSCVQTEPLDRSRHTNNGTSEDTVTVTRDSTEGKTVEVKTSSTLSITSRSSSMPIHGSSSSGEHCSCSDATTDGSVSSMRTSTSEQLHTLLSDTSRNAAMYYSIVTAELTPSEDETQQG